MKLITAIIQPHALQDVTDSLREYGVTGLTVTEVAGQGEKTQVEVQFRAPHGAKRLLLRYAPLTKVEG